jgi:hypothetical protein
VRGVAKMVNNKKPHIQKVKLEILSMIDTEIEERKGSLITVPLPPLEEKACRRELAIWIRQRNKIAKDAGVALIELNEKDGQGKLIY